MVVIRQLVRLLLVDDAEATVISFRHSIMGSLHSAFGHEAFSKTFPGGALVELISWAFDKSDPRLEHEWVEPPSDRRTNPFSYDKWPIGPWADDVAQVIIRDYEPTFLLLDVDLSAPSKLASEGSGLGVVAQAGSQDTAEGAFVALALANLRLAGRVGRLQVFWLYSGFGPTVLYPARVMALPAMKRAGFMADLKFKLRLSGEEISHNLRRQFEINRVEELTRNKELREILFDVLRSARGHVDHVDLDPEIPLGTIETKNPMEIGTLVRLKDFVPEILQPGLSRTMKVAKLEQLLGIDLSEACSMAYNCYGTRVLTHPVPDWHGARDRIGVHFEEDDGKTHIASAMAESERLSTLFEVLGERERAHIKNIWRDRDSQFAPDGILSILSSLQSEMLPLRGGISTELFEYRAQYCKYPHHVGSILQTMQALGLDRSPGHFDRRTGDLETIPADDLFYLYWPFLREGMGRPEGLFAEPLRNIRSWAERLGFDSFCDFVSLPDARELSLREKIWVDPRSQEKFQWHDDSTDLVTWIHCFCLGFLPAPGKQIRFDLHRFDLTAFADIGGVLDFDFAELMIAFGRMLVLAQNGTKTLDSGRNLSDVIERTEDAKLGRALAARFGDVIEREGGIVCLCFKTCTQFNRSDIV